jgi:predicted TPR repeat methyltransferase
LGFFDYSGSQFDFLMATSVIHYVEDKLAFFRHARTMLNTRGLLILELPITEGKEDTVIWDKKPPRYVPSRSYLEKVASEAGFELVHFGLSNLKDRRVFHFSKR